MYARRVTFSCLETEKIGPNLENTVDVAAVRSALLRYWHRRAMRLSIYRTALVYMYVHDTRTKRQANNQRDVREDSAAYVTEIYWRRKHRRRCNGRDAYLFYRFYFAGTFIGPVGGTVLRAIRVNVAGKPNSLRRARFDVVFPVVVVFEYRISRRRCNYARRERSAYYYCRRDFLFRRTTVTTVRG